MGGGGSNGIGGEPSSPPRYHVVIARQEQGFFHPIPSPRGWTVTVRDTCTPRSKSDRVLSDARLTERAAQRAAERAIQRHRERLESRFEYQV